MMTRTLRNAGVAAAALLVMSSVSAVDITGAGASFPAPIYTRWADAYQEATGNRISYQSIGSVGGRRQIAAKTVDFGASDMPLKPEALDKDGLVQFPTVIGGVVPVVNLAGVKPGELKVTGPLLADIYIGKITKWNDKAIADLNPGVTLPATDIGVVRRSDGSGTTFLFTNYLSKVSAEWRQKVGEGTAVRWRIGFGGKGNEGVSAFVRRLPGSIGYVEYAYARQNKLSRALLKNASGVFVAPDNLSFNAAAAQADWTKSDFAEILTEQAGRDAWPIAGATFVMMHKVQDNPAKAAEVLRFFEWCYENGAKMAEDLDYVPLPETLVNLIRASWVRIKDASGKPVFAAK